MLFKDFIGCLDSPKEVNIAINGDKEMKKLMFAIGLGLISSSLYAACMGPFCYDDTGASIGGLQYNGNGQGLPVVSSTTVNTYAPPTVGIEVWCNTTCTNANGGKGQLCISTGTAAGAFIVLSSATAVTNCK